MEVFRIGGNMNFKSTLNGVEMTIVFPEATSVYEKKLQEHIFATARESLKMYLKDNRPDKIRSDEYFGNYYNPDVVILDKDVEVSNVQP